MVAIEGEESPYTDSIQALFDFAARFPFPKQESNHQPILLFFHFCQIRGRGRFYTQSKHNYESDSTQILTVAVYENVLHDSIFLLRWWRLQAVRLSTYRTSLVYGFSFGLCINSFHSCCFSFPSSCSHVTIVRTLATTAKCKVYVTVSNH